MLIGQGLMEACAESEIVRIDRKLVEIEGMRYWAPSNASALLRRQWDPVRRLVEDRTASQPAYEAEAMQRH
jgi:hypothetical protein